MGRLAYVFPGQGAQSVGMLQDVAASASIIGETFSEASDVLGYDLWTLVQDDPDEKLSQTEFTQPALLAASIALFRLAMQRGLTSPDVVAGHSLGEYSALVAASVIEFNDAVALVQKRGQFMQTAVPVGQGGMAAVLGLDENMVEEICSQNSSNGEMVQAVNFNAPGQIVIAGHLSALHRAIAGLKQAGAKRAMLLAVSAPFHSELMRPAADEMSVALAGVEFSVPAIDIIQNVSAEYESDPDSIRLNLVKQMYSAVLWTSSIERLTRDGVELIVECGPGKVLTGLNKRISRSLKSLPLNSVESFEEVGQELCI